MWHTFDRLTERKIIMKWKYVPFVGLVVTFVKHVRTTKDHHENPTTEAYQKTWEAFDDYFAALVSSAVPVVLAIFAIAALSLCK